MFSRRFLEPRRSATATAVGMRPLHLLIALLVAGCGPEASSDDLTTDRDAAGAGPRDRGDGGTGLGGGDSAVRPSPPPPGGAGGPGARGPLGECETGSLVPLEEAVQAWTIPTPVDGFDRWNAMATLLTESPEGTAIAWAVNPSPITHLTHVDHEGRVLFDVPYEGYARPIGLRKTETGYALLAIGDEGALDFLSLDPAGSIVGSHRLIEGGESDEVGTTWAQQPNADAFNRLVPTPTGWAVYLGISRMFGDGVHQGDTLLHLSPDGRLADTGFGWGCSHSAAQRSAHDGEALGTVCVDDCNPYGVRFDRTTDVDTQPGGPCRITSSLTVQYQLSTMVPGADGYWLVYSSPTTESRADPTRLDIVHLDHDGTALAKTNITEGAAPWQYAPSPQLAAHSGGFLTGWRVQERPGGPISYRLQRLDGSGSPVGDPTPVAYPLDQAELITYSNGDVGYGSSSDRSELVLVRVAGCR